MNNGWKIVLFLLLSFHAMASVFSSVGTSYEVTYTVKDGLPQNSVADILKNDDGLIWVCTKDGLSRFDGYDFKNFKADSKKLNRSVSNQFVRLQKDAAGCLWILNDIGQVLRFDTKNESFQLFPSAEDNKGDDYFTTVRMKKLGAEEFWMIGNEEVGAIRLLIDTLSHVSMHRFFYNECNVKEVFRDNNHGRWILGENALYNITDRDTVYSKFAWQDDEKLLTMIDVSNECVIGAERGKIVKFDKQKRWFTSFQLPVKKNIEYLYSLKTHYCCAITSDGWLFVINLIDNSIAYQKDLPAQIEEIRQSENGDIYLKMAWENASCKVSASSLELESGTGEAVYFPASIKDTLGVRWHATEAGLSKQVDFNNSFQYHLCVDPATLKTSTDISAVMEDEKKRLWVASKDGVVRLFDTDMNIIGYLNGQGNISKKETTFAAVSVIYQDRSNRIWMATEKNLVYLSRQSDLSYNVTRCVADEKEFAPLSDNINDILEDSKGRIWLATQKGGLHLLQMMGNRFRYVHKENLLKNSYPPIVEQSHCLMEDRQGNIWMGASEGVTVFSSDFESPEDIRFLFYNTENTNLTSSTIYDIYQDTRGKIWMASYGGGLFCVKDEFVLFQTPEFVIFNCQNGLLSSDLLLDITEDEVGNLWILTEESVVKYDNNQSTFENYGEFRGFLSNAYYGKKIIRRYSGSLMVVTNNGMFHFYPKDMHTERFSPKIQFTRFLLFNKEHEFTTSDSPIDCSINYADRMVLQHNQSVFSIGYAASDYRFPEQIQYAYKLEPFEKEWNYVGTQRLATYTNLPKGEYVFRVKSTNSDGVWQENERTIPIIVLPSFWQSAWGYAIYIVGIVFILGIIAWIYRMRTKIRLEQEVSDSKLQFFTDISHELRTPLTLINAPLENVLEHGSLNEEDRNQLELVRTSTHRMLRMMNQILDFRKIQNNKMRLKVEKTDFGHYVSACSSNFLKLAENRNIKFSISDQTNNATFWVDRDKLDTVMFNLLSNAFKFTQEGKSVSVTVKVEDGYGVIVVADEGCGMPKDKLSQIFERYTTLQNYSLTKQSGTGIGLSLVKEIVDMHKATIHVESEENIGSKFTLRFKPGISHFDNTTDILVKEDQPDELEAVDRFTPSARSEKKSLLIVEDNDQMREFLKNVLKKKFSILEANNGKVGYETTVRELPHFVISDIMMPEMDGIEMTKRIRKNEQTSHIPVVLLTAKTDLQSKIECMKLGANDYITKPFSVDYLEARIENILEDRRKWQERYRSNLIDNEANDSQILEIPEANVDLLAPMDDELMRKFVDLIEQNMDNVNFTVEDVQDALKVSRWHLLSKVKSLVGITPNEFIREKRLSHAAKLIDDGELNMTQVAYTIGMSDSRYFSRCFKQKFGMTPTEYKNRKR